MNHDNNNKILEKLTMAITPWVVTCTTLFLLILLVDLKSTSKTCDLKVCYCETFQKSGFFIQPLNAWSCMSFVIVSGLIGLHGAIRFDHSKRRMQQDVGLNILFSVLISFIGTTSMFFHGFMTSWAEQMDGMSINLFAWFLVWLMISRQCRLFRQKSVFYSGFFIGSVFFISTEFWVPEDTPGREIIFGSLIGLIIVGETILFFKDPKRSIRRPLQPPTMREFLRCHYTTTSTPVNWWAFVSAFVILAIGFGFWISSRDTNDSLCHADGVGHGIWHICDALTAGLLYVYHISEPIPPMDEIDESEITYVRRRTSHGMVDYEEAKIGSSYSHNIDDD